MVPRHRQVDETRFHRYEAPIMSAISTHSYHATPFEKCSTNCKRVDRIHSLTAA
jgi:hypothetical protein